MSYIPRIIEKSIKSEVQYYPVLAITGPRQSGKTTLVKHLFQNHDYYSLENPDTRSLVLEDPRRFLTRISKRGAILDEIQRTPELLSYLQGVVDEEKTMGKYILTGSAQFELVEVIAQTTGWKS